jgi:hypothetical protein
MIRVLASSASFPRSSVGTPLRRSSVVDCLAFGMLERGASRKTIVETALERAYGNVSARLLKTTCETLRYRVEKFGLGKETG